MDQFTIFKSVILSKPQLLHILQRGDRLESTESDVYRRQILTTKVDPRTVRVKNIAIAVDP